MSKVTLGEFIDTEVPPAFKSDFIVRCRADLGMRENKVYEISDMRNILNGIMSSIGRKAGF